ncbi:HIT bis 5 -adenosyl triphosphatase [Tubulinosema ratisbonensis]|uniref:HIT bis 5-adenosyl triphosphatase n=1 Tax=Tubulinosema ratisbonensis TaxID=291195 RepID=A0A437ALC3_9MICR|nr:HIT bis 5 -adenosyl triphosphatase [Tubulinosema ratisbonensis]
MIFEKYLIHPDTIIFQTDKSFIFLSYKPFTKYHLLISPIKIKPRLKDLTKEELLDLSKCVYTAVKVLKRQFNGCSVGLQDGKAAGQSVFHLHFHVLPLQTGHFDCERQELSHEEMKNLAQELKPFFLEEFNN